MAASSGETRTLERLNQATFTASGFQYHVSGGYLLEFEKGNLHGAKAMPYFIGSGTAARSFLIAAQGFLFEAPAAYYSAARKWDLAPGYTGYPYPYVTRPVLPGCLNCHASFLEPVPGAENRFHTPPFREGGVACERCHGPGDSHIRGGPGIINPAKLRAERRDSICAQCHLLGEVRVMRPGADWKSYHPGDKLSESMTVFVRSGNGAGMKVTSHVENLAQSRCKRMSGDRLWCGTCHDPHSKPNPAAIREKCLGCHPAAACIKEGRNDCIACHMPKHSVTDAEHVVFTDHSIPRRARPEPAPPSTGTELVPFGGRTAAQRDIALANAITNRPGAVKLLEAAEQSSPNDVEVLLYLAEIYRKSDRPERAVPLYQRAIRLDPSQVTASVGLGAIFFDRQRYNEAIPLWEDALSKNSGLVLVATNLAMARWRLGKRQAAEDTLRRVIGLSPGFQPAADLLKRVRLERGR